MRSISEKYLGYSVMGLVLLVLITFHLIMGPTISADFRSFDRWSAMLLNSGFDYLQFWSSRPIGTPETLYTTSISLIALLRSVAPEYWHTLFYYLNLLWMGLTLVLFYASARLLSVRHAAIAITLPLFVLSIDFLFWPRYLLTDTFFSFMVMVNVYLSLKIWSRTEKWSITLFSSTVVVHAFLLVMMLFSRPVSLPYFAAFILFNLLAYLNCHRAVASHKAIVVAFLLALSAILFGQLMHGYASGQISGFRELSFLGNFAQAGVVIIDRPETYLDIGSGASDYARLFLVRAGMFFSPYAADFSVVHNLINLVLHGVVAAAIIFWFVSRASATDLALRASLLVLMLGVGVALFHSFTIIDYDWRYRFPIIAPLLLIVALSADSVLGRIAPLQRVAVGKGV